MIYVNTLLLCSGLILCPRGRCQPSAPPGKDEKNFMYQKTMIVITIAFVSCISWLRSGMERYADRKLSLCCQFFVSGFVGLLTYPFMCRRHSSHTNALLQPSLRAMTALPMTGFHRAQDLPCTENNALEIQLLSESCRVLAILNVQTADPATDSFRVRDLHPIPLFSEQACVSDCSGRACATKAMVCNFYQCAVVSCESSFAKLSFFGKRCIRSFHCFL